MRSYLVDSLVVLEALKGNPRAKFYGVTLMILDSDFKVPANAERIPLFGGETDG